VALKQNSVERDIRSLLAVPGLKTLVGVYFHGLLDREGRLKTDFAGHLFDSLPDNPPDRVVASDLVAVTLLDVRFGRRATDALLNRGCLDDYLALDKLPADHDLWSATEDCIGNLYSAHKVLDDLHGVGPVKASKLLARKRPRLAPITDSHVENFFGCFGWEFLIPMSLCLSASEELRDAINDLCPDLTQLNSAPSTLRLLDVAIWMTRSRARSAADGREVALGRREPLG